MKENSIDPRISWIAAKGFAIMETAAISEKIDFEEINELNKRFFEKMKNIIYTVSEDDKVGTKNEVESLQKTLSAFVSKYQNYLMETSKKHDFNDIMQQSLIKGKNIEYILTEKEV